MSHTHEDEERLLRTLKALAALEAGVDTPSHVEAAVIARWDSSRRRSRRTSFVRGVATMAAGVVLLATASLHDWRGGETIPPASPVQPPSSPLVAVPETVSNFTRPAARTERPSHVTHEPTATLSPWMLIGAPLAAGEPVRVVRMRVPSSALGQLGLRDTTSVETIDIDVLVGEDGVARGVRMVM